MIGAKSSAKPGTFPESNVPPFCSRPAHSFNVPPALGGSTKHWLLGRRSNCHIGQGGRALPPSGTGGGEQREGAHPERCRVENLEAEVGRPCGREVDRCSRGRPRFADLTSADSADPGRPKSSDVNPVCRQGARNGVDGKVNQFSIDGTNVPWFNRHGVQQNVLAVAPNMSPVPALVYPAQLPFIESGWYDACRRRRRSYTPNAYPTARSTTTFRRTGERQRVRDDSDRLAQAKDIPP
ncbi:hypothetical protein B0H13DRAFT_1893191 [Mycena leptocephala]|nr:hypothetical protein B0H13DRAFT_1893191 [Mycena leptocephala]